MSTDRWTNMTKLMAAFRTFANKSKKITKHGSQFYNGLVLTSTCDQSDEVLHVTKGFRETIARDYICGKGEWWVGIDLVVQQ